MISVLFVRKDSIYKQLTGCDCYDFDRNALTFPGGTSVIAHPPCRAWGKLKHFAKPRQGEKELAIWAINQIRINGGVLEHPHGSSLWKVMNLPLGNQTDIFGGFTISVNQHWFGHKAEKKTLLYICGCDRNEVPASLISFDAVTHMISSSFKHTHKLHVSKKDREATPIEFAKWLIQVASICKPIKNNNL